MEADLSAHLRDVALVLADLEKNGITAKPSKSFFAMQRLRVIGLIVSKLGIQVNPDRLQAITEFQMPKNKTAVRRLLGMANQIRYFCRTLSAKLAGHYAIPLCGDAAINRSHSRLLAQAQADSDATWRITPKQV